MRGDFDRRVRIVTFSLSCVCNRVNSMQEYVVGAAVFGSVISKQWCAAVLSQSERFSVTPVSFCSSVLANLGHHYYVD